MVELQVIFFSSFAYLVFTLLKCLIFHIIKYPLPPPLETESSAQISHHGQGLFSVIFRRQSTYFERHLKLSPILKTKH